MTEKSAESPRIAPELKKIMEDPARKKAASSLALLAVDRFNNIYGTKFGQALVEQFASYIIEQATDVDADVLKKHTTNMASVKLIDPDAWGRRKAWLSVPKGPRLLKALMGIVRESDKTSKKIG